MAGRRRPVLLVDKEETEFWEYAWTTGGADLSGSATEWVPAIVEAFVLSSTW